MRKVYLTLIVLLIGFAASAQQTENEETSKKLVWNEKMLNIMLDTRFDFYSTINNGDVDDLSFNGQSLKVWFSGEIIPGIRYRVRHRLNKPQNPLERDNLSGATDQAWVAFDLGNWTFTVGKQTVQLGTFEFDYLPGDIYMSTMICSDFDGYKTGLNAAYRVAGQTFNLQIVNSDSPQFASEKYKNKALAGSFLWEGNLFQGTLKTRFGYSAFQHSKSKFYQWVTLGSQLNLGHLKTELDYYIGNRNMDYTSVVGLGNQDNRYVKDQSGSLNMEYNLGKWRPAVKGVWSKRYDQNYASTAYENYGIQAVAEYYPFKKELVKDLRFHFMYGFSHTKFKGQYASVKPLDSHTILVGLRWLFKVK